VATIRQYEEIDAWRKARALTVAVYRASGTGEFARDFGLKDQIRRASVSVMSNIAEGFERDGTKEFLQFLSLAKASSGEVRSQLYVALDVGYVSRDEFESLRGLATDVSKMIRGFISYLSDCEIRGSKYQKDLD
jgi:four helix bundle protein